MTTISALLTMLSSVLTWFVGSVPLWLSVALDSVVVQFFIGAAAIGLTVKLAKKLLHV